GVGPAALVDTRVVLSHPGLRAAGRWPGPPGPARAVPRAAGALHGQVTGPPHPARVRADEPGPQAPGRATPALAPPIFCSATGHHPGGLLTWLNRSLRAPARSS